MREWKCIRAKLVFVALLLIFITAADCESSLAQSLSGDAILTREVGMHTAPIRGMGVDAEGRYLVTGSDDKTVRVWEIATGRLFRVLHPPIGQANEGRIFATAISPSGDTIACGGWTGYEWDRAFCVYLFDRASGQIVERIAGLPDAIKSLAYSPDGRFLAITLGGKSGMRLYRVGPKYTLEAVDDHYGGESYGADFNAAGRLVTSCYDGFVRLYSTPVNSQGGLRLLARTRTTGGSQSYSVSFSPDGSKIGVSFRDSGKIEVLSSEDLALIYSPACVGVDDGNLLAVTWSKDGLAIYAAGQYNEKGVAAVRKWTLKRGESCKSIPAATNTITRLASMKSGAILYATAEPGWGVINENDQKVIEHNAALADYRQARDSFSISNDVRLVQFSFGSSGKSVMQFSVTDRSLTQGTGGSLSLRRAITRAPGLTITGWKDTALPMVNGKALAVEQYETSRSLAISPDGGRFLLGTEFYLRLFSKQGNELSSTPAPAIAWCVNISQDSKVAVAAFSDGTIRWYSLADGKELLAFFTYGDARQWVVWNSSGYYDASPGGDELIGWQVNRGKNEAADFFPVSRFRAAMYRPGLGSKILDNLNAAPPERSDTPAGREDDKPLPLESLPPVVSLISPSDGAQVSSTNLTLRYTIRSRSKQSGIIVKALVDGRPVAASRGLRLNAEASLQTELSISIPERDCEVAIVAEGSHGSSVAARAGLKWRGATNSDEFIIKPRLYILAVGIGQYATTDFSLDFPAKDARDFTEALTRQNKRLYRDVVIKLLTDAQATKDEILDGFDWIRKETTSKDVAMIFLAGHGVTDQNGIYYFCPTTVNPERLLRTGVPFSDIKTTLEFIAGKVILFIDTCHAGGVLGKRRSFVDINGVINELTSAENGVIVFAASTGSQYSLESDDWNNGAFTKALVEGINGKADYTRSGRITVNMLDLYISERVKELTKGRQTPTTIKPQTVPDFPLAVRQ